jgi:hypothetical protein
MPEQFHTFQCAACGNAVKVKLPQPSDFYFVNVDDVTIIAWPHEKHSSCEHCGVTYAPAIMGMQPQILWHPVEKKKEESRIVIPQGPLPLPPMNRG